MMGISETLASARLSFVLCVSVFVHSVKNRERCRKMQLLCDAQIAFQRRNISLLRNYKVHNCSYSERRKRKEK